jgi:hypothetical protein
MAMKRFLLPLVVLIILSAKVCAQCQAPEFYNAYPSNGLDCMGGMEQYLSRTLSMIDLNHEVRNDMLNGTNVAHSYVAAAADLDALYLSRVSFIYGYEYDADVATHNNPGDWGPGAQRVVQDIRTEYNNRGLREPIIEAAIFEHITTNVNGVPIPAWVISEFDGTASGSIADPDYIAAFNSPTVWNHVAPATFDYNKICYTSVPAPLILSDYLTAPDITRVMARMWFYYLARTYIDWGYKALHMGWIARYTKNDALYVKAGDVFSRIRNYARSRSQTLLMNADTEEDLYVGNPANRILLLDFNRIKVLPDEAYTPSGSPLSYANLPCDPAIATYNNEMCELDLNRVDVTTNQPFFVGLLNSTGGISPNGCTYDKTPVQFALDFTGHGNPPGVPAHNCCNPWGYDEQSWFFHLGSSCQTYWLYNAGYAIKNDLTYRGYLVMPGLIRPTWDPNYLQYPYSTTLDIVSRPDIKSTIESLWMPHDNTDFTITKSCEPICYTISQNVAQPTTRARKYGFKVTDPDGSSVYTWHVKRLSNGTWFPFTFGNERALWTLPPDDYAVTLKQDNLGFACPQDAIYLTKYLHVTGADWENSCSDGQHRAANNVSNSDGDKQSSKIDAIRTTQDKRIEEQTERIGLLTSLHDFKVFPNPAAKEFNVSFMIEQRIDNMSIDITNSEGAVIKTLMSDSKEDRGIHRITQTVNDIPSGVYYIRLRVRNNSLYNQKIVIEH